MSSDDTQLLIGCVAENTPKYLSQALRLLQSVRWFGGDIASSEFRVCVIDGIDPSFLRHFEKYRAQVRIVPRYNAKVPVANKIRFLQQEDIVKYDKIILLDCDTILVKDPSNFLYENAFMAKIADYPTIPHDVFVTLFDFFDINLPAQNCLCTVFGEPTIPYFNTGVLIFSNHSLSKLVPDWIKYTDILIDNLRLIAGLEHFCEQASMSLAIQATGEKYIILDNEMNFPTNFEHKEYSNLLHNVDPFIIHYHSSYDSAGYINKSKYTFTNLRINMFNERLRKEKGVFSRLFNRI